MELFDTIKTMLVTYMSEYNNLCYYHSLYWYLNRPKYRIAIKALADALRSSGHTVEYKTRRIKENSRYLYNGNPFYSNGRCFTKLVIDGEEIPIPRIKELFEERDFNLPEWKTWEEKNLEN